MRNTLIIARRELSAYFVSPLAYIVIAGFLVVNGVFFYPSLYYGQSADIRPLFQTTYTVLLLLVPVLSMRLISEEQRSGTIELLLTSPVRESEVVLGKFLAGLGLVAAMLGLTLVYPLFLYAYGNPDFGVVVGGYLGAFLFSGAAIAIGLLASSLTENQVVAAVVSFAALLFLWMIDWMGSYVGGIAGTVITYVGLYGHFTDFSKGVIDTTHIVYFLSLAVGALFLTARSLEVRRWKG